VTLASLVYALLVGGCLALAARLLEEVAAARHWPRRWIWAGALAGMMLLGFAGPSAAVDSTRRAAISSAPVTRLFHAIGIADGWTLARRWFPAPFAVDDTSAIVRSVLVAVPAAAALWYAVALMSLSRRRRTWREANLRESAVLIAPDTGPAVVGIWRTHVVVPAWALNLESSSIDLLLTHEREHERAKDPLLIHLGRLAAIAIAWNPAAWWICSRLKLAVELDCDARVLGRRRRAGADDVDRYGRLLLMVAARGSVRPTPMSPALFERASALKRRIVAMTSHSTRRSGWRLAAAVLGTALLVGTALFLPAPVRAGAQAEEPGTNGVSWPSPTKQVHPEYTDAAKQAKITGIVKLSAVVKTDGTVDQIRVIKSLDQQYGLDDAAIDAASKWTFKPCTKNNQPVACAIELEMEFRLR
jgi:TonB family protein